MLRIMMAASEAVPFAKTGGLADVCGSLPRELARLGHDTSLIIPAHRCIYQSGQVIDDTDIRFDIPIGGKVVSGRLLESRLPDSEVPVYLVEEDEYFDRDGLYGKDGQDYQDNCERFVFFSRAVMEAIRLLELNIDVLHVNDWQTALIPAYLDIEYRGVPGFENTVSVITIHNIAYQGCFWHWDMLLTGLDWNYFNWRQMEYYGDLNLLKTGLVFADSISTVSPRYAKEIRQTPLGCGLEGVLHQRRDVLFGIINGVNYDEWNPESDPYIPSNYTWANWKEGKARCKTALQEQLNLPKIQEWPLIGIVSRLVQQKGMDLIEKVIAPWVGSANAQWVILGTGDPSHEQFFQALAREYPDKVAAKIEFNSRLSHMIEAGADIFLMPSSFEPCGLNQLYSLKYGTVPVVHGVGGLADTIVDADTQHVRDGTANGFRFDSYSAANLDTALRRAYDAWRNEPEVWDRIVSRGMQQDWSWNVSAGRYEALYQQTIERVKQTVCA